MRYWMGQEESPKSNLHVYGRDDTKIVVYSMGRYTKKDREEEIKQILR